MRQIKKEILSLEIQNGYSYPFEIPADSIYLIEITASAKSWWQNTTSFKSFFQDDDLAVKIDNIEFPKLNGKKGLFDGEAAWNWGMGHIDADRPFILSNLPTETQNFVKEVLKMHNDCNASGNKSGKISVLWLIEIGLFMIVISFMAHFFFFEKKEFALPEQYKNYKIIKEEKTDINKDGEDEKIVVVSNMQTEYSSGDTRTILIKKDGTFLEISQYGSKLQWQKIGDFNKNGKTDITTFYGYSGSAGFGQLYLQEWSGNNFRSLLSKEDVENTAELKDLDGDGIEEIVYSFHQAKWGREDHRTYKWDGDKMMLVLI